MPLKASLSLAARTSPLAHPAGQPLPLQRGLEDLRRGARKTLSRGRQMAPPSAYFLADSRSPRRAWGCECRPCRDRALAEEPCEGRSDQPSPLRPGQVIPHARPRDPTDRTDLPLAQTADQKQPQHILNLPHGESPCRHRPPFLLKDEDAMASEPSARSFRPEAGHPSDPSRPPFRRPLQSGRFRVGMGGPPSLRKGGRLHVGIPGRIHPEYAFKPGLRAGGDNGLVDHREVENAFQSTPPRGRRLEPACSSICLMAFQSTP